MNTRNTRCNLAALLLVLLLGAGPRITLAQAGFDGMFVFGDSLSDPGNAYALTGETAKAPYALIPSAPYAIGGHHFTNGKTWAERFAQLLHNVDGGKPAFAHPGKYGNYAFGGARTRDAGNSPSSSVQVSMFLADVGNNAPANALYVLQFGGNDIRDALLYPANAGSILVSAVQAEISNIVALHAAGARHFAIANAPNLARAPAVIAFGGAAVAGANALSQSYNDILENGVAALSLPGLTQLEAAMPDVTFYRIDFFGMTNELAVTPWKFGISDPVTPCLSFGTRDDAKCDNPEEHAFWDGIHPTSVIHDALADIAAAAVAID